jgi:hypothetical protein
MLWRLAVKKILFVGIVFLLAACEEWYKTKQVINNSDYEVTFIFNHFRETEYTLKPHTSDYYTENAPIKSYSSKPPKVSYTHDYESRITEFFNTPAMKVKIVNELDRDILITANGTIDNEPVTVLANNELTVSMYTINPELSGFTIDRFPVNFTYSIGNLSVRVHW